MSIEMSLVAQRLLLAAALRKLPNDIASVHCLIAVAVSRSLSPAAVCVELVAKLGTLGTSAVPRDVLNGGCVI